MEQNKRNIIIYKDSKGVLSFIRFVFEIQNKMEFSFFVCLFLSQFGSR